jgi:predicted TIM-barrel fold metal-dependent hydrolase
MRTVTLEEHYATPKFMERGGPNLDAVRMRSQLCDLDSGRIADMDAAGIDVQVLSIAPGIEQLDGATAADLAFDANYRLAEAVRKHPKRFAGFAALPTAVPDIAAKELERAVRDYGFRGAAINGHTRGRYLDDAFFRPILERAEALRVPIYLHPTAPPQPVIDTYYAGNYPPEVVFSLATGAYGWHVETAIHVLRIIVGGVFDRYPDLQLVIGHLGETLSFMLPRLDLRLPPELTKLKRRIGDYLRENVHYTISGFNFTPAFLDLLLEVGAERIMFSADYPYSSMVQARTFLDQLPVSPADKERIAHGNAERLLRL